MVKDIMGMFNDTDDFMHSNPKEKFFDILFNASSDVVQDELEAVIKKFVAMEALLEEAFGDEVDIKIDTFLFENGEDIANRSNSFYVDKMAKILSKSV